MLMPSQRRKLAKLHRRYPPMAGGPGRPLSWQRLLGTLTVIAVVVFWCWLAASH